jgi:uncharacterized YigZ family protein
MALFSYQTLTADAEGVHKEKGSRFLAFAFPVSSEESAKEKLMSLRKKYFDASHHCYAYSLRTGTIHKASDDGEPSHSAGDPILGQIRSKNLANVLIVVVRYFGGVKLGMGGLIQAYRAAAENALSNASIIEREITKSLSLTYDYAAMPEAMKLVKSFNLKIRQQSFATGGSLTAEIKTKDERDFVAKVKLLKALGRQLSLTIQDWN